MRHWSTWCVGPGGEQLGRHPGGSPANVAIGLARLGHRAELLTWVGEDADGRLVTDHLADSGVALVPGSRGAARTSTATAHLDGSGVATYDFELDPAMPTVDLDAVTGDEGFDVVHTGSIAAVLAPGASVVEGLLSRTRHRATVSYDPNARPALMGEADVALAKVLAYVGIADVVKVSDEDLDWLRPGVDPLDVAGSWLMRGASLVVVTRGRGRRRRAHREGPRPRAQPAHRRRRHRRGRRLVHVRAARRAGPARAARRLPARRAADGGRADRARRPHPRGPHRVHHVLPARGRPALAAELAAAAG